MGLLDDAIREHLELKRKHGAPDDEVSRQEAEALGPARREVAPAEMPLDEDGATAAELGDAPEAEATELLAPADSPLPPPEAPFGAVEPVDEAAAADMPAVEEEPPLVTGEPVLEDAPGAEAPVVEPPPVEEPPLEPPPVEEPPVEEPPVDVPGEPPAQEDPGFGDSHVADRDHGVDEPLPPDPGPEYGSTPPHGHPALPDEDADADEQEDVLEETPDFLQESPEHDRLWFEQKPPRDFDFD